MRARLQRRSERAAICLALFSTLQLPPRTGEATIVPFCERRRACRGTLTSAIATERETEGYWPGFCGGALLEAFVRGASTALRRSSGGAAPIGTCLRTFDCRPPRAVGPACRHRPDRPPLPR